MQQILIKEGSIIFNVEQGQPIKKYVLTKKVGEGSQGSVYYANLIYQDNNNQMIEQEFAVKFTNSQFVSNFEIEFLEQLKEYQNSQNEIIYPTNIIKVFDIFYYNGFLVTVMEKADQDLYDYNNQNANSLTMEDKIKICLDITYPIYFLHSNGLMHRDLKPENYVKVENKFKLIDFGVLRRVDKGKIMTVGVGTIMFCAPEILDFKQQQQYTEKIDIWSLGCIFYEIICKKALFNETNHNALIDKIINHKINQTELFSKIDLMECDFQIKNLIKQMLSPNPSDRVTTFQIIEQLKKYLEGRAQPCQQFINFQNQQIKPIQQPIYQIPFNQNNKFINQQFKGWGNQQFISSIPIQKKDIEQSLKQQQQQTGEPLHTLQNLESNIQTQQFQSNNNLQLYLTQQFNQMQEIMKISIDQKFEQIQKENLKQFQLFQENQKQQQDKNLERITETNRQYYENIKQQIQELIKVDLSSLAYKFQQFEREQTQKINSFNEKLSHQIKCLEEKNEKYFTQNFSKIQKPSKSQIKNKLESQQKDLNLWQNQVENKYEQKFSIINQQLIGIQQYNYEQCNLIEQQQNLLIKIFNQCYNLDLSDFQVERANSPNKIVQNQEKEIFSSMMERYQKKYINLLQKIDQIDKKFYQLPNMVVDTKQKIRNFQYHFKTQLNLVTESIAKFNSQQQSLKQQQKK